MLKDRLKQARKAARKTQIQVAEAVGMKQSSYSELETGRSHASTLLPLIANYLGVDALWLQNGYGDMIPQHMIKESSDNHQLNELIKSLQCLDAAKKLPPELVAMLQNAVSTIVSIQDNQDQITAGQAPAIGKKSA